ncbi:RNA-directed DNA polymerase from mobile element jockey-like, partial [Brachionus plicatilis]
HPLDSYIESFDPTVETIIQNTIVQSPPPQTELPFLIPTFPQIVRNSLTESSPNSKPQPKTLSTPIAHTGSAQLETQISSSYESHYESNNESNDKTQTKFKKERMKRNTSVLANTKKKSLKSTSSIDDNAFFDANEEIRSRKSMLPIKKKRLVITHWNCFHLPSRIQLLEEFLSQNCLDILLLNEIKINMNDSNFYFNFKNYTSIVKARNRHGGGIAMLVRDVIEFKQDYSFDNFSAELLCIKMYLNNTQFFIYSLYNPPNTVLPFKLFLEISSRCGIFIIGGDFNAKSKSIGCFGENENGLILEEIFSKLNLSAINDTTPTYNRFKTDHFEVLDLFLIPSSLSDKVLDFKVLLDHDMLSDHFPIQTCISTEYLIAVESLKTTLNFKKANWELYRDLLKSSNQQISSFTNIDDINKHISEKIVKTAQKSVPAYTQKSFKSSLPKKIVLFIKERRKIRRFFQKTRCPSLKIIFNKLTSEVRLALKEFWNQNWQDFIYKMGKNTLSSRPFWKKINKFRSKKCSKQIPSLLKDGIEFKTDIDKGKIFGNILASTFSPHLDLVESEDSSEITQTITDFLKNK